MSALDHARRELELAGMFDADSDYGGMMGKAVLKLMEIFAYQGHSGFSASMAVALFRRLAAFKPLTPITDEPDQWEPSPGDDSGLLQHKRYSSVFKDAEGNAFDVDAVVFEDKNGARYTCRESRRPVAFPYAVPDEPEVVKVRGEKEEGL